MRYLRRLWERNNPLPDQKRGNDIKMTYDEIIKELALIRMNTNRWINENDPMRLASPCNKGLYLIGNTLFNPHTEEKIYIIKVGTSSNLNNRMRSYRTDNPLLFHIDFIIADLALEPLFHLALYKNGGQFLEGCDEWFKVSEEMYFDICTKGFQFFNGKINCEGPLKTKKEIEKEERDRKYQSYFELRRNKNENY